MPASRWILKMGSPRAYGVTAQIAIEKMLQKRTELRETVEQSHTHMQRMQLAIPS